MFRFAICYRRSVCRLSVCDVGAPYSAIFLRRLVPWPSTDIHWKFYGDHPRGTPMSGDLNARGVVKYSDFDIWNSITSKRCKIGGKLVLITNRKLYMGFRLVPKLVTLNDLERRNGPFLPYVTEFGNFRRVLRKSGWQSHNYGQFLRLLCLVKNVCRGTTRRPRYKYSITTRCKFCSRFIHSRLNAQYLPNYRLLC